MNVIKSYLNKYCNVCHDHIEKPIIITGKNEAETIKLWTHDKCWNRVNHYFHSLLLDDKYNLKDPRKTY